SCAGPLLAHGAGKSARGPHGARNRPAAARPGTATGAAASAQPPHFSASAAQIPGFLPAHDARNTEPIALNLECNQALQATTADLRTTVQTEFAPLGPALLTQRLAPTSWSILECLAHLNSYSRYYNAAFAQALAQPSITLVTDPEVTYSWLGRKSVAMMQPTNLQKQTALKRLNPLGSQLGVDVLIEFDQHHACLVALLAQAEQADLNRAAIPVEFFRLLKLR
nr:hypothetical protein [Tanacetum cinerariifolium]